MHKSVLICPSILNANHQDLRNEIIRIEDAADFLHLDIHEMISSWENSIN